MVASTSPRCRAEIVAGVEGDGNCAYPYARWNSVESNSKSSFFFCGSIVSQPCRLLPVNEGEGKKSKRNEDRLVIAAIFIQEFWYNQFPFPSLEINNGYSNLNLALNLEHADKSISLYLKDPFWLCYKSIIISILSIYKNMLISIILNTTAFFNTNNKTSLRYRLAARQGTYEARASCSWYLQVTDLEEEIRFNEPMLRFVHCGPIDQPHLYPRTSIFAAIPISYWFSLTSLF